MAYGDGTQLVSRKRCVRLLGECIYIDGFPLHYLAPNGHSYL